MELKPHPRLYAGKKELARLKKTAHQPLLKQAADEVLRTSVSAAEERSIAEVRMDTWSCRDWAREGGRG